MKLAALDDAAWGSPWRHRRVSEKVLLSGGLVTSALVLPPWPAAVLVATVSVVVILGIAKIRPTLLWYAMLAPAMFILVGAGSVAVSVGEPLPDARWNVGWFSVSDTTLVNAGQVATRAIGGTLGMMVLGTTTPMVDLLTWLRKLHVPAPLLEIASLTYRMIFVVLSTALAVNEAQTNRLGGRRPWHSTATLMGATLVRSWDRSARIAQGLELRGFDAALITTPMERERSWTMIGSTVALCAAIAAVSLMWRWPVGL